MTQSVNVPGVGQLNFPDGMSQPDMAAAIQRNFPQIHDPVGASSADIPLAPGATQRMAAETASRVPDQEDSLLGKIFSPIDAAISVGTGLVGGIAGIVRGGPLGIPFSNAKNAHEMENEGGALAESLTYQPRTQAGQKMASAIGNAINDSGIMGVPIPELNALGRSLPIARALGRVAPVAAAVAPAVDLDIPTYQRVVGPPKPARMPGPPPRAIAPLPEAASVPAPSIEVPAARQVPIALSPLDAYTATATESPYGALHEPVAPPSIGHESPIDAFARRAGVQLPERAVPLNQFDDMLRESGAGPSAPKSPLDLMIGERAPAAQITSRLRNMSDIDSILAEFGVKPVDSVPARAPEITHPAATAIPADAQVPSVAVDPPAPIIAQPAAPRAPMPGPPPRQYLPMESVERAAGPIAPIDSALRVPEPAAAPVAPDPAAQPAPRTPMPGPGRPAVPAAPEPFVATQERHVDPLLRVQNLQALRDVGLGNIRESAVTGDAATAAREYQHGKITSEPAGQFWFDQFQAETDAMKTHAQGIIDGTGGRTGLDETAMTRKGMDIAAPYDAARGYFERAKKSLYDIANNRAAESGKPVGTASVDALLADPDFRATLMAKDQQGLLGTIESQYARFKALDESGLSVANAENFRKWLNKVWSPDKSAALGEVKGALDSDVFKSAGEDVYAEGRKMHILEKQTLDNPNGIAKLMDSDPNTPINRNTDYHKIPDGIMALSEDQFKHIIDTYRALPPELQPLVQRAVATLKAHYTEKFLDKGAESGRGNPRQLWNTGGVKQFVGDNSAKIPMLFDLGEMQKIGTMLKAGEVLRVNPAYPGAAAQLANAAKSGLISHLLGRAGGGIGGTIGAVTMGPVGAGVGGLAGEATAGFLAKMSRERKALARAKEAIIAEHRATPRPSSPIDDWEAGLRH